MEHTKLADSAYGSPEDGVWELTQHWISNVKGNQAITKVVVHYEADDLPLSRATATLIDGYDGKESGVSLPEYPSTWWDGVESPEKYTSANPHPVMVRVAEQLAERAELLLETALA